MSGTVRKSTALSIIAILVIVAVGAGSYSILVPPAPTTRTLTETKTQTVTQTGAVTQTVTQQVTRTITQQATLTSTTTVTAQPSLRNLLNAPPPPPPSPPANKRDGTLIMGFPAPPQNLDSWHIGFTHNYIMYGIYDTLIMLGPDGKFYPSLATAVVYDQDKLAFTVTLRKGVKFHDGSPLTVEDVKATFDRGIRVPLFRSYTVTSVKNVEIIDDSTLRFNLKAPDVDFLYDLSQHTSIHSKARIDKLGEEIVNAPPMGSGPFKFVEYVPGDRFVEDRNDDYWAGPANVKRIVVRYIREEAVRTLEVQKGGIHIFNVQDNRFIGDLKKAGAQLYAAPPGFQQRWLIWSNLPKVNPWSADLNVRKAINYAIDRKAFIDVLEVGEAVPGYGVVPPYLTNYFDPNFRPYQYNVAKAREFMAKSSFPNGFTVKLLVSTEPEEISAPIIISQLGAIGIKVQVDKVDGPQSLFRRFNFGYEMTLGGLSGSHPSPGGIFALFFHTKNVKTNGQNIVHTNGTTVGKLLDGQIDTFMKEIDPAKRRPFVREFEATLIENAVIAPLYFRVQYIAMSYQLKGFQFIPSQGIGPAGSLQHAPQIGLSVWLDPDEAILKPSR